MKRRNRILLILAAAAVALLITTFLPPIPQPQEYHDFADQREVFGVANLLNVISNLPFLLVGAAGIVALAGRRRPEDRPILVDEREKWPWMILFLGTFLTAFGSGWYHLSPSNESLFWDRLPMTLVAMSLLAAVITERINVSAGLKWLPVLLAVGVGSVILWIFGERDGAGDLRAYGVVQFLPIILIPLIILLFPPRYTHTSGYFKAFGWYLLAKVGEALDQQIYAIGNLLSGHTLKHLLAAVAIYALHRMLLQRQATPSAAVPSATGVRTSSRRRKR